MEKRSEFKQENIKNSEREINLRDGVDLIRTMMVHLELNFQHIEETMPKLLSQVLTQLNAKEMSS